MAQMLDFNAISQPTWPVKLKDDNQTVVNLAAPTVQLVDRLIAMTPELEKAKKTKDGKTIRAVYQLVAEVMNCNEDGFVFTVEELRDTYKLTLYDVYAFVAGYFTFIKEIQEVKN